MKDETYFCLKCNVEWNFYAEDYDYIEEDYPDICPFCCMPKWQLFRDVYEKEGFIQAVAEVLKRLF